MGRRVKCPYCQQLAKFVDSKVIYRKSYGMIYICFPCDARVGIERGTDKPLGTLANKELREARKRAHAAFDPLWKKKGRKKSRGKMYRLLADAMNIQVQRSHIAMFDVIQCQQVFAFASRYLETEQVQNGSAQDD